MRAVGRVEVETWEEQPYGDAAGEPRLGRAEVAMAFHGEIEGRGSLVYLTASGEGGRTGFVGLERVVGRLGGRAGSFVLQHQGVHEAAAVRGTWTVAPGTGTGDLSGLRGEGTYVWDGAHGDPGRFTLNYEIEPETATPFPTVDGH